MSGRSRTELARDLMGAEPAANPARAYQSPGARKEKLRERDFRPGGGAPAAGGYAELRAASALSFLDGASLPEDLVARAAELDLPAVALVDRAGVYGAPRFWKAARQAGVKALVGAEVALLEDPAEPPPRASESRADAADRNLRRPRLTLLVESRAGYRNLCRLLTSQKADFKWRYFNADGGEAEMCGNGGRCAARFAYLKRIAGPSLKFETLVGILSAQVKGKKVKLEMTKPFGVKLDETLLIEGDKQIFSSINTGVPHAVFFVEDLEELDIVRMGRAIRYHSHFTPSGTNANFVRLEKGSQLLVRTYERGVEDETLAMWHRGGCLCLGRCL